MRSASSKKGCDTSIGGHAHYDILRALDWFQRPCPSRRRLAEAIEIVRRRHRAGGR